MRGRAYCKGSTHSKTGIQTSAMVSISLYILKRFECRSGIYPGIYPFSFTCKLLLQLSKIKRSCNIKSAFLKNKYRVSIH